MFFNSNCERQQSKRVERKYNFNFHSTSFVVIESYGKTTRENLGSTLECAETTFPIRHKSYRYERYTCYMLAVRRRHRRQQQFRFVFFKFTTYVSSFRLSVDKTCCSIFAIDFYAVCAPLRREHVYQWGKCFDLHKKNSLFLISRSALNIWKEIELLVCAGKRARRLPINGHRAAQ